MPTESLRTLTNGARQFVVQDAHDKTSSFLVIQSSFMPNTIVLSTFSPGAEIIIFFAPFFI